MVKAHYNISMDVEIWDQAKRMFPHQVSTVLNDYLRTVVNANKRDVNSVQIEIERLKLKREVDDLSKLKASISERENMISEYEKKLVKENEKRLTQQREELEKEISCFRCKGVATKKFRENPICDSCFMNL
jgi:hypothetical protein